ncbi:polypyrimidine tract-binding protein homolog 2-like isoform X2 [Tasmannia lanceolata]|uniref:polypyrimidine tract-binding protein homolog 2-like isoform X2 n=1 Tax=Tasmannia lanceolata TaxID=3420 RepID=UPI0040628A9A
MGPHHIIMHHYFFVFLLDNTFYHSCFIFVGLSLSLTGIWATIALILFSCNTSAAQCSRLMCTYIIMGMCLVFSAYGFVHKIATFEKTAGFQALVQFSDSETSCAAKNALDGRSIPRYLLQEHVGPCTLRITFSGHTDLNVKFQSHRSRDYTNPYLPVAASAIDGNGQFCTGLDGKKQEPESNVLLASIENMQYAVNVDVLHTVFSAFGPIQKIAMFEKNAGIQALVQYADVQTAIVAKEALEGHCIYDGGFCKLHLSYSRHTDLNVKANNDRSRDYTIPNTTMLSNQPSILGQQPFPMVGMDASQYNNIPFGATPNGIMGSRPLGNWNAGLAVMASLPAHVPNHMYPMAGALPPNMGAGSMQLGQGQDEELPMQAMSPFGH